MRIEELVKLAGLRVINANVPTHVSGTAIDLILASGTLNLPFFKVDELVGSSDHHLVYTKVAFDRESANRSNLGRIAWLSGGIWDVALQEIAVPLGALAEAIEAVLRLTGRDGAVPTILRGKKLRRNTLDTAAWSRDVPVVWAGHCAEAVKVKATRKPQGPRSLNPASFACDRDFREAIREAVNEEQSRAVRQYTQLGQLRGFYPTF